MDIVILSIFSRHAADIYEGKKRAELRKSFTSSGVSMVFLYETNPIGAVTGVVFLSSASKLPVKDAVVRAEKLGVPPERASSYFEGRSEGWVLGIGHAFQFKKSISLKDLQNLNHYFRVPQVFAYLDRFEGLSQFLLSKATIQISKYLKLISIHRREHDEFRELVMDTVGSSYEGIDDGFVSEILSPSQSKDADFSSERKEVKAFVIGKLRVGYTVLTLKRHGAIKTGPTVFLPAFRGLGLGLIARQKIESYAKRAGFHSIYCTCPDSRPSVVAYLATSGMTICAILKNHLGSDRNEYVLVKQLEGSSSLRTNSFKMAKAGNTKDRKNLEIIEFKNNAGNLDEKLQARIEKFLVRVSELCYFKLGKSDVVRVFNGLRNHEKFGEEPNSKSKRLFFARARNGQIIGVAVFTHKRSSMVKINWFSETDNPICLTAVFETVRVLTKSRRYYTTIGMGFPRTLLALVELGFGFEGRLPNPFGAGDHACLGLNAQD